MPRFEGDHKPFLSEEEERDARTAAKILEAALILAPHDFYGLWWYGRCCVLLGENERNRGRESGGMELYDTACGVPRPGRAQPAQL